MIDLHEDRYPPLDPHQPVLSFREIAVVLGVSPSRAVQLHNKAIRKIRRAMAREANGVPIEKWAFDED